MDTFSSNITIIIVFFAVLLIFITIDFISKNNRKSYYNKDTEQQNTYNDNNDKLERRLKVVYWSKLEKIYDSKPNDVLKQAKAMLEEMQGLHTSGSLNANDFHNIDEWYLKLCELRILLDHPVWQDDSTNPKEYKMPLFIELDIQYISDLLKDRELKSQKRR